MGMVVFSKMTPAGRKAAIITTAIVFAIILIVVLCYIYRNTSIQLIFVGTELAKDIQNCQFCQKPATLVRKPVPHKIAQMQLFDLDPTFAELQTIYCCEECKAIAGGFRTTVWHHV